MPMLMAYQKSVCCDGGRDGKSYKINGDVFAYQHYIDRSTRYW